MYQNTISSSSYQPHISLRRRSSLASSTSSNPSSPVDQPSMELPFNAAEEGAIKYTYLCDKCGFGTNLLSSFMPHSSNPCDKPVQITWGKL